MATIKQRLDWAFKNEDSNDTAKIYVQKYRDGLLNSELQAGGLKPVPVKQPEQPLPTEEPLTTPDDERSKLQQFSVGVGKGVIGTVQGLGQLVSRGAEIATRQEKGAFGSQETFFKDPEALKAKTGAEKVGKFVEEVAEFAVPATKVAKVTEGANFLVRLGSRILSSGGVASAQEGEVGKEAGIAAGVETVLGVGGAVAKPVFSIVRRLFKGLGSGLSGVSTDAIDTIVANPKKALEVSSQLEKSGNFAILEENARAIVNGVSRIRQEARKAFGEGLEKLQEVDIKPKTFRDSTQSFLDSIGSSIKEGVRTLKNIEFENPKLIEKASNLIDELNTVKLDGVSLRRFLEKVGSSRFKTTGSDPDRLAFNAFIKDFEKSIKGAINKSTDKLGEINKAFSKDVQLAEGIERIFGKIKFKSLKEIDVVAQKLESLFSQKGLNPRDIDRFLNRIGISPEDFRTSEATRQIGQIKGGANSQGLTFAELTRSITSAVVTPTTIRNISIATGLAQSVIRNVVDTVEPSARAILIKFLVDKQEETSQ